MLYETTPSGSVRGRSSARYPPFSGLYVGRFVRRTVGPAGVGTAIADLDSTKAHLGVREPVLGADRECRQRNGGGHDPGRASRRRPHSPDSDRRLAASQAPAANGRPADRRDDPRNPQPSVRRHSGLCRLVGMVPHRAVDPSRPGGHRTRHDAAAPAHRRRVSARSPRP